MFTPSTATTPSVSRSPLEDSFKESSDLASNTATYTALFVAQSIEQLMSRFVIRHLSPFEITEKAYLQEWYYGFKSNFGKTFPTGRKYLYLPLEEYQKLFSGQPAEIRQAVNAMEHAFHSCFTQLLEQRIVMVAVGTYDRARVENELIPQSQSSELEFMVKNGFRLMELQTRAAQGNYTPLLNYLLAYSADSNEIWKTFIMALATKNRTLNWNQKEEFLDLIYKARVSLTVIGEQIDVWYRYLRADHKSWFSRLSKDSKFDNWRKDKRDEYK